MVKSQSETKRSYRRRRRLERAGGLVLRFVELSPGTIDALVRLKFLEEVARADAHAVQRAFLDFIAAGHRALRATMPESTSKDMSEPSEKRAPSE